MLNNKGRRIAANMLCVTAAVIMLCSCFFLSGCSLIRSLFGYVEFTRAQITLEVGESYDLDDIVTSNGKYDLRSSSPNIASLNGSVLTANKAGKARITATSGENTASLFVTVTEHVPDSLEITTQDDLIQTIGATSAVLLYAETTGSLDNKKVSWYVNDEPQGEAYPEEPFELYRDEAGIYEIKAVCGDFVRSATLRVYEPVEASGNVSGETTQRESPYSPLTLGVSVSSVAGNPDDYVQWYVDGTLVYEGTDLSSRYTPTVGQHTLTLKVNGVERSVDGKNSVTLYCVGSIVPTVITLEYDNLYPHAYLLSEYRGKAQIEITSPSGVTEYSQTTDPSMFTPNGIDVGAYVDIAATGSARQSYKFRVKSLGDGGALTESEYSDYYTFAQLPSAAGEYLSTRYADKDFYVTSVGEYVNIMEYAVLFRNKKTSAPKVSFDCYIAFDYTGSADDLFSDAFEYAATSGSYDHIRNSLRNNIMHTEFIVNTVNNPSQQTKTSYNSSKYASQLHAVMPHINYDENKYRNSSYEFAIDRRADIQPVSYSDELYFAAENGSRPLPVSGSSAETIYAIARNILREIVTDDMTDMQKAHAIYDWIMWQVTYDTPATEISRGGESYSAYYLEGVFGDGSTSIDGVKYAPYAVCDGMSKAYSLMCNIEGIPCKRVTGVAGSDLDSAGGHAWNKVCIDGEWYVVDCTWGDSYVDLEISGQRRNYELGLHDYLFRTDDETDVTHFEPFEAGNSNIDYSPSTASKPLDVYSTMTYNGVTINCMVKSRENQKVRLQQIAQEFARAYTKRSTVYVPGGINGGIYSVDYEGIEICLENDLQFGISEAQSIVRRAVQSVHPFADVKSYNFDGTFIILMKK